MLEKGVSTLQECAHVVLNQITGWFPLHLWVKCENWSHERTGESAGQFVAGALKRHRPQTGTLIWSIR